MDEIYDLFDRIYMFCAPEWIFLAMTLWQLSLTSFQAKIHVWSLAGFYQLPRPISVPFVKNFFLPKPLFFRQNKFFSLCLFIFVKLVLKEHVPATLTVVGCGKKINKCVWNIKVMTILQVTSKSKPVFQDTSWACLKGAVTVRQAGS